MKGLIFEVTPKDQHHLPPGDLLHLLLPFSVLRIQQPVADSVEE